jgi:amylosucrase
MVESWNSLATRDTRMLASLIARMPRDIPSKAAWVNYIRCHDDIGWGFDETKARELGFDPFLHKRFLIAFYLGAFPGSFSRGELYESDPRTLDARNCGTCASLCGLEKALAERDEYQQELALKRIALLHGFCMAANGLPVIYSGDELAALNDYSYVHDPHKGRDSRNLHRQKFDWAAANRRDDQSLPGSMIFHKLRRLIRIRAGERLLGSSNTLEVVPTDDRGTICVLMKDREGSGELVLIANFTEHQKSVLIDAMQTPRLRETGWTDLVQGKQVRLTGEPVVAGPYELLLLKRNG